MKVLVLCLILASSLIANISLSHYPVDKALPQLNSLMKKAGGAKAEALAAAMAMIPAHAIVSADYAITPHLTHREKIYMFPNPFRADNWGVNDETQHDPETVQYILVQEDIIAPSQQDMLVFLVSSGQFEEVFSQKGVHLYKRIATWTFEAAGPTKGHGLMGYFFAFDHDLGSLPQSPQGLPEQILLIPQINFPVSSGEFKTDDVAGTQLRSRFMAIFDGFLNVPAAGEYSFTVYSDDGFRLKVDKRIVCEFPGIRAFDPTHCRSTLKKGATPIRLQYFNNAPPHGLQLMWQTPEDSEPKVIDSSYFYPSEEASLN
jgi:hypothetical protein